MNPDEGKVETSENLPEVIPIRHTFDPSHRGCLGCLPPSTDPLSGEATQDGVRVRRVPRYEPENAA